MKRQTGKWVLPLLLALLVALGMLPAAASAAGENIVLGSPVGPATGYMLPVTVSGDAGSFKVLSVSVNVGSFKLTDVSHFAYGVRKYGGCDVTPTVTTDYIAVQLSAASLDNAQIKTALDSIRYSCPGFEGQTVTVTGSTAAPEENDIFFDGRFYSLSRESAKNTWLHAMNASFAETAYSAAGYRPAPVAVSSFAENSLLLAFRSLYPDLTNEGIWLAAVPDASTDENRVTFAAGTPNTVTVTGAPLATESATPTEPKITSGSGKAYRWLAGTCESGVTLPDNTDQAAYWHGNAPSVAGGPVYHGYTGSLWSNLTSSDWNSETSKKAWCTEWFGAPSFQVSKTCAPVARRSNTFGYSKHYMSLVGDDAAALKGVFDEDPASSGYQNIYVNPSVSGTYKLPMNTLLIDGEDVYTAPSSMTGVDAACEAVIFGGKVSSYRLTLPDEGTLTLGSYIYTNDTDTSLTFTGSANTLFITPGASCQAMVISANKLSIRCKADAVEAIEGAASGTTVRLGGGVNLYPAMQAPAGVTLQNKDGGNSGADTATQLIAAYNGVVTPIPAEAKIDGKLYLTLDGALGAAASGKTVSVLQAAVTPVYHKSLTAGVTLLSKAGHTYASASSTAPATISVDASGTVTLSGGELRLGGGAAAIVGSQTVRAPASASASAVTVVADTVPYMKPASPYQYQALEVLDASGAVLTLSGPAGKNVYIPDALSLNADTFATGDSYKAVLSPDWRAPVPLGSNRVLTPGSANSGSIEAVRSADTVELLLKQAGDSATLAAGSSAQTYKAASNDACLEIAGDGTIHLISGSVKLADSVSVFANGVGVTNPASSHNDEVTVARDAGGLVTVTVPSGENNAVLLGDKTYCNVSSGAAMAFTVDASKNIVLSAGGLSLQSGGSVHVLTNNTSVEVTAHSTAAKVMAGGASYSILYVPSGGAVSFASGGGRYVAESGEAALYFNGSGAVTLASGKVVLADGVSVTFNNTLVSNPAGSGGDTVTVEKRNGAVTVPNDPALADGNNVSIGGTNYASADTAVPLVITVDASGNAALTGGAAYLDAGESVYISANTLLPVQNSGSAGNVTVKANVPDIGSTTVDIPSRSAAQLGGTLVTGKSDNAAVLISGDGSLTAKSGTLHVSQNTALLVPYGGGSSSILVSSDTQGGYDVIVTDTAHESETPYISGMRGGGTIEVGGIKYYMSGTEGVLSAARIHLPFPLLVGGGCAKAAIPARSEKTVRVYPLDTGAAEVNVSTPDAGNAGAVTIEKSRDGAAVTLAASGSKVNLSVGTDTWLYTSSMSNTSILIDWSTRARSLASGGVQLRDGADILVNGVRVQSPVSATVAKYTDGTASVSIPGNGGSATIGGRAYRSAGNADALFIIGADGKAVLSAGTLVLEAGESLVVSPGGSAAVRVANPGGSGRQLTAQANKEMKQTRLTLSAGGMAAVGGTEAVPGRTFTAGSAGASIVIKEDGTALLADGGVFLSPAGSIAIPGSRVENPGEETDILAAYSGGVTVLTVPGGGKVGVGSPAAVYTNPSQDADMVITIDAAGQYTLNSGAMSLDGGESVYVSCGGAPILMQNNGGAGGPRVVVKANTPAGSASADIPEGGKVVLNGHALEFSDDNGEGGATVVVSAGGQLAVSMKAGQEFINDGIAYTGGSDGAAFTVGKSGVAITGGSLSARVPAGAFDKAGYIVSLSPGIPVSYNRYVYELPKGGAFDDVVLTSPASAPAGADPFVLLGPAKTVRVSAAGQDGGAHSYTAANEATFFTMASSGGDPAKVELTSALNTAGSGFRFTGIGETTVNGVIYAGITKQTVYTVTYGTAQIPDPDYDPKSGGTQARVTVNSNKLTLSNVKDAEVLVTLQSVNLQLDVGDAKVSGSARGDKHFSALRVPARLVVSSDGTDIIADRGRSTRMTTVTDDSGAGVVYQLSRLYIEPETPASKPAETQSAPAATGGVSQSGTAAEPEKESETEEPGQTQLAKDIKNAAAGARLVISTAAQSGTDSAAAELDLQDLDDMRNKDIELVIQTEAAAFSIPPGSIDTEAVAGAVGMADHTWIPIRVTVTPLSGYALAEAMAAVEASGYAVTGPIFDFTITAGSGGSAVVVQSFHSFVPRELTFPGAADTTTGVIVEPNGGLRHVPTYVYERDGVSVVRINSRSNSVYALIRNRISFADAKGRWYEAAVNEMGSRLIINGRSNDVFDGGANITRAEFATILVRALGLSTEGSTAVFSDVSPASWYFGPVCAAYEYGLIEGKGAGLFDPRANITRQEAMLMLQRAAKLAGFSGESRSISAFYDADSVRAWALEAAQWNVGSGLIKGDSAGMIRGGASITRGETATIVLRLLQYAGLVDTRVEA